MSLPIGLLLENVSMTNFNKEWTTNCFSQNISRRVYFTAHWCHVFASKIPVLSFWRTCYYYLQNTWYLVVRSKSSIFTSVFQSKCYLYWQSMLTSKFDPHLVKTFCKYIKWWYHYIIENINKDYNQIYFIPNKVHNFEKTLKLKNYK